MSASIELFIGGLSNDPSPAPNVHSYPRCVISRSQWFTAPTWRVQAAALFLPGDNRVRSRFIYPCPMHLMGRCGDKEAGFAVQLNVRQKNTGPRSSVLTIRSHARLILSPLPDLSINYFLLSRLRRFLWRSWFILWERGIQRICIYVAYVGREENGCFIQLRFISCPMLFYIYIYICAKGRICCWIEWLL